MIIWPLLPVTPLLLFSICPTVSYSTITDRVENVHLMTRAEREGEEKYGCLIHCGLILYGLQRITLQRESGGERTVHLSNR